jgi:hypothetical protein
MRRLCVCLVFGVVVAGCVPAGGGGGGGGGGSCDDCRDEPGSSELEVGALSADLIEGAPGVTSALKLRRAPAADVTVSVVSLDPGVATVSPGEVVFTPGNWSGSQLITITGVDDNAVTGPREAEIEFTMQSEDPAFANRPINSLFVDVLEDDELASVRVQAPDGVFEVGEDGAPLTLEVTLSAQPSEDVLVPIEVSDEDEVSVSAQRLTFGPLDWNLPQEVTLRGVDDEEADGDQAVIVSFGPTNSLDALFNGIAALEVTVVAVDGVCGNGIVDGAEGCEPGPSEVETCAYGERSCTYCTDACEELPGQVTGYCGDRVLQSAQEECDEPAERCPYGQMSCETCTAQCVRGPGQLTGFCGDGIVQSGQEECDPGVSACCDSECNTDPQECAPDCLVISEYLESFGNNKAFEIHNCDASAAALSGVRVCLVTNANTTCTSSHALSGTLPPGGTHTICNPSLTDPGDGACDERVSSVTTFNGDDRLVIFADVDGDRALGAADIIVDAFGEVARRPVNQDAWSDRLFRRCDTTPYPGVGSWFVSDYFNEYSDAESLSGFGVAPDETCLF